MFHQRSVLTIGLIVFVMTSLACSLGSSVTPEPTATAAIVQGPTALPATAGAVPTQGPAQGTPTPIPPTDTPTGSGPGGCILSEQFIADVSIPDGTVLAPNSTFVKTWRVKNNGTCTWEGYQLIFATGDQLGGPAAVAVNSTQSGNTADVSANLTAPAAPGEYKGVWRFQATNGSVFGSLTVVISVPVPATATPTPTTMPAIVDWSGGWQSNCGAFDCGVVNLVQSGRTVTGTFANGGVIFGSVADSRLSGTWSRGGSSGSFDWWMGGSGQKWRGNYGAINGWCGYRAGQTEPIPCGVATFAGDWNSVGEQFSAPLSIYQDGSKLVATLSLPSGKVNMEGSIDSIKATGVWTQPGGASSTFTWYLINSVQFNGNYDGNKKWCGFRSGANAPADCLKP